MTFDGIAPRFHQMSESGSKIFLEGDSDIKMNRERFILMSSRSNMKNISHEALEIHVRAYDRKAKSGQLVISP
jgi:hypothetical protein